MALVLKPRPDGSSDEHRVMHGSFQVGSIKKMATRSSEKWIWSLSSLLFGPPGIRTSGVVARIEEAMGALNENWGRWLKWADLSELPAHQVRSFGPEVLSVTISRSDSAPGEPADR